MKGMEIDMKKIAITVILLLVMVILGCNQVYAVENALDLQDESQLIEIKENAAKTLEEYKQKYGTDGVVSFTKANGAPFTHVSSLIQINIKGNGDLKNATITGIAIEGDDITTLSSYSFDNGNVNLDTDSDNVSNEMLAQGLNRQVNSTDQTFYFIVNAGTVFLSDVDLTIAYASATKKYKAKLQGLGANTEEFVRGKQYSYTLKISDGVLTMTGNEIKEWETGNNVGEIVINGEEQQDE